MSHDHHEGRMMPAQPTGRYGVRMGMRCQVHKHRSMVPLEVHHIWPLGDGGPDVAANKITVCANAHYSTHALLDLYRKTDGQVAWEIRREFGTKIRALALQGWIRMKEAAEDAQS